MKLKQQSKRSSTQSKQPSVQQSSTRNKKSSYKQPPKRERQNNFTENLYQSLESSFIDESLWCWDHYTKSIFTDDVERIASAIKDDFESPVLITGETGTGKEVVANRICKILGIEKEKFISINCAAITPSLMESELFGHVKGAFSGAAANKNGYFESVNEGVLFLDEISVLEPHLQAKLLRVVEQGEFFKVGASQPTKFKTRIIAATNKPEDLRFDLRWRFPHQINLKPLRERRSDIFVTLHGFLRQKEMELKKLGRGLPEGERLQWTMAPWTFLLLMLSPFPGNVRELLGAAKESFSQYLQDCRMKIYDDRYVEFIYKPQSDLSPILASREGLQAIFKGFLDCLLSKNNHSLIEYMRYELSDFDPWENPDKASFEWDLKEAIGHRRFYVYPVAEYYKIFSYCSEREYERYLQKDPSFTESMKKKMLSNFDPTTMTSIRNGIDFHFFQEFKFPPEIRALVNEGLPEHRPAPPEQPEQSEEREGSEETDNRPIDLTGFSEKGLLEEYWRQLHEKYPKGKDKAEISGISTGTVSKRLQKYELK